MANTPLFIFWLLILDEPTNGLDPAGIQEMRALIHDMPDACGATVLISSHLLLRVMLQVPDQRGARSFQRDDQKDLRQPQR